MEESEQTKEILAFLEEYSKSLSEWINAPTVLASKEVMGKIQSSVELSITIVQSGRKVYSDEKDLFNGGVFLVRYFDGWGEEYLEKYLKMVNYIKENHY